MLVRAIFCPGRGDDLPEVFGEVQIDLEVERFAPIQSLSGDRGKPRHAIDDEGAPDVQWAKIVTTIEADVDDKAASTFEGPERPTNMNRVIDLIVGVIVTGLSFAECVLDESIDGVRRALRKGAIDRVYLAANDIGLCG